MSLDDGKIEILPPADLDVTMLPDPPSVSPRESQFQEPVTEEPLLSTPKLNIENLFIDSPRHSGVDEVESVLWEKEIEKFGRKLKSVPGEECFLGLFDATEEQVSDVVKKSEERLDQVVVEKIPCIYRPSRKRKKNSSKESDMKGRKKQRADKSGSFKNKNEKKGHQVKRECIDEVESVKSMKEVEKKLWLIHYEQLSEEFMKVFREKCVGCQNDEGNLGHELFLLASIEEQVLLL